MACGSLSGGMVFAAGRGTFFLCDRTRVDMIMSHRLCL